MEQPKKKRPTRHVARVPCKDAEELSRLHKIAAERGMTFSGMVRHDYLKVDVERIKTPYMELMSRIFEELREIRKPVRPFIEKPDLVMPKDLLDEFMSAMVYLVDLTKKEFDEHKRKSSRLS